MRVLVVDDEFAVLSLMEKYLAAERFKVYSTADGAKAVQLVQQEPYDVILLDIMMPKMNGFTICQEIRKSGMNKDVPVVFVTARTDPYGPPIGFKSGGTAYLTKPFSRRQLVSVIRSVLPNRKTSRGEPNKTTRENDTSKFAVHFEEIAKSLSHD